MEDSPWNTSELDDNDTTDQNAPLCEETVTICNTGEQEAHIFTLVPIQNLTSNNSVSEDSDEELQLLLKSWGCSNMYDYFHGENVTIHILKIIKQPDVKKLVSGFKHGDRILFEHHFEKWRSSIGWSILPGSDVLSSTENLYRPSCSSSPSVFSSSCPSGVVPPEEIDSQSIDLAVILSSKRHGRDIVSYYDKHSGFQSEHRHLLINLIAEYFEENDIPMTLKASHTLEREILDRFPTESLGYYRTEKRGKIYIKAHNIKRKYKPLETKKQKLSPTIETKADTSNLISEADAESCVRSLKFDNLSAEEFDSVWSACTQYRLLQIRNFSTQGEIFEVWPQYKSTNGYRLIEKDFNVLRPQSLTILENWEKGFTAIKKFLIENIKDKKVTEDLKKLEECDANKENAVLCILKSLHNYLVPTKLVVTKPTTSKAKSFQRFTIKDSQQAFIFEAESVQQLEDHLDFLKSKNKNIQPFILALSKSQSEEEYFVYLNGFKLKFKKLLRAVDICLKIFFVFDLQYPLACEQFWVFIQSYFYSIAPLKKNVTTRLSTIVEMLKNQ